MLKFFAAAAALLVSSLALAHHSPSAYDTTREVTIEGTLAKVEWANPHIYLTLETQGPNGLHVLQQVESVSISAAQAGGLTRDLLPLGSTVVVHARPNRRGSGYTVLGSDITMSDGTIYALAGGGRISRPPVATVPAKSIAGNWTPEPNPRLAPTVMGWPLTDKGREALAAVLSGKVTLTAGCEALPLPMLMQVPPMRAIEVGEDRVVIKIDADGVDATRTVHLDLAAHPANVESSLFGHSIGRWEGGTLVIDTAAFAPNQIGVGFGIPSGTGKHLVERLTLAADGLRLRYELTVEDPEYLAAPATYTTMWDHRPDLAFSGSACDPQISERYKED